MAATLHMAREAKRSAIARSLANRKQVNGIGITRNAGGYALKVNLVEPIPGGLPTEIDGVPVSVDLVGPAFPA
jgi:hypothetical protein